MMNSVELRDGASLASIAPSRGGMASRFRAGGRDLFYLDEVTFADAAKNVRGGNPVLFPSPGKLADDAWSFGGRSGAMKQHGFARSLAWQVEAESATSVTLALSPSDATRAAFPYEFRAALTYTLSGATLRIEPRVTNSGKEPMPFGFGFHPYFQVTDKARARIATAATRAFDNVTKTEVAFRGFDLTLPEVDLHLLDHDSTECALDFGDGARLTLRGSPEFTHWVLWTLAGKDFVCVEPWTCPGNALNTGDRVLVLSPGETRALWIEMTLGA